MKKYYYVSYEKRYKTAIGSWIEASVINEFPLDWIAFINKILVDERCVIISWNEITEEQYERYKNDF